MPFAGAIQRLSEFKDTGVILGFVIIGAVAATVYIEPVFTEDLDNVVPVDSGEDYYEVFRRASVVAERVEGMHLFFDDTPVQLFPTTMKPVYRDVLVQAEQAQVNGAAVKVAFAEHFWSC